MTNQYQNDVPRTSGQARSRTDMFRTSDNRPICFQCNAPGHVARYCRNKPQAVRAMRSRTRFNDYNDDSRSRCYNSTVMQIPNDVYQNSASQHANQDCFYEPEPLQRRSYADVVRNDEPDVGNYSRNNTFYNEPGIMNCETMPDYSYNDPAYPVDDTCVEKNISQKNW